MAIADIIDLELQRLERGRRRRAAARDAIQARFAVPTRPVAAPCPARRGWLQAWPVQLAGWFVLALIALGLLYVVCDQLARAILGAFA